MPPLSAEGYDLPPETDLGLEGVREHILTGLLRAGSLLGTLTFAVSAPNLWRPGTLQLLVIQTLILGLVWVLALYRRLDYWFRGGLFLAGLYALSISELVYFGFSEDAPIFFVAFSLLSLLLFDWKVGSAALLASLTMMALMGWLIVTQQFSPLANPQRSIALNTLTTTCLNFLLVVGSIQAGIVVLFGSLRESWRREHQARTTLEHERDWLEQRVAARTHDLAQARDEALAARRHETAQKEYLAALYQTTLDLLNRRNVDDVLQVIVERATLFLDAPFGELMLIEGDELVVHAFTANQPFLCGDRVRRGEALLSWQAYDTRQPAVIDDYSNWAGQRALYNGLALRAVADFPVIAGTCCVGVLAMSRVEPGYPFSPEDIHKGIVFSQLAALAVENARLYDASLREIRERTKAEQALQVYAAELKAHNVDLEAFAHTVAHDLKTPLSSLLGYNQLLKMGPQELEPEQIQELIAIIEDTGKKMAAIIDALLLLASVRTREDIPFEALEMTAIVSEVVARLQGPIAETRATLMIPEHWPATIAYAPWIEEVWVNYISNALKYGGSPPQIALGADPSDSGQVCFWVQDNGPGLSPDEQTRLFTPFTRLHADRTHGHGLGLSIVQQIITRLGGEVGVESEPGTGSKFYFTLPSAPQIFNEELTKNTSDINQESL